MTARRLLYIVKSYDGSQQCSLTQTHVVVDPSATIDSIQYWQAMKQ
jgi:hypothetical protein